MRPATNRVPVIVGSRHGTVWGVDPATGRSLWRRVTGDNLGGLIQSEEAVYMPSSAVMPIREAPDPRPYPNIPPERRPHIRYHPQRVTALNVADGSVLWLRDSWARSGMGSGAFLVRDLLLIEDTNADGGSVWVQALDAETGEPRWKVEVGPPYGHSAALLAAHAGRALMLLPGDEPRLCGYDTQTAQLLWSRVVRAPMCRLSSRGELIACLSQADTSLTVYRTADGSVSAHVPSHASYPLALSDTGIAYESGHAPKRSDISRLTATRLTDSVELWYRDGLDAGQIVLADDVVFVSGHTFAPRRGQVTALDAATGRSIWRWRSPRTVFGLLWLWRRHVLTVLAFAMRQFRNTIKQAHKDQRRGVIWHEILHGQWWHPGSVFNYIRLFIHADSVYVGTNMGLFALDARTGRMKWYTLPTCEL